MLILVKSNLIEFEISKEQFIELIKKMEKVEKTLISGKCFENTVKQQFNPQTDLDKINYIKNNKNLNKLIFKYLKLNFDSLVYIFD